MRSGSHGRRCTTRKTLARHSLRWESAFIGADHDRTAFLTQRTHPGIICGGDALYFAASGLRPGPSLESYIAPFERNDLYLIFTISPACGEHGLKGLHESFGSLSKYLTPPGVTPTFDLGTTTSAPARCGERVCDVAMKSLALLRRIVMSAEHMQILHSNVSTEQKKAGRRAYCC